MSRLCLKLILLLVPSLCYGQFKIQGPSDGNRQAQGASYDGQSVQYDDRHRDSLNVEGFTIQGASDGSSDYKIQGASDGNSDFQIHGASSGGLANFQIQGATDGHSQSTIQNTYDANRGPGRALQYRDPSGLSVNWQSYQPQAKPQPQNDIQYAPQPAPVPRRRVQQQRPQYQQAPAPAPAPAHNPNFKVFDKAPSQIQQLIQFQQQIPYLNVIPPQFRHEFQSALALPPQAAHQQRQQQAYQEPIQEAPQPVSEPVEQPVQPTRSQYRGRPRGHSRQRRTAQNKQAGQAQAQPQYQAAPQGIQELLKFQAQIPYVNGIPEQWRYDSLLKQQGAQPVPQYQRQPEPEPVRHSQRVRQRRAADPQQSYHPPAESQPHYNPNLPAKLQQLLQFQAQTPYTNGIPEQFRFDITKSALSGHRQKRAADPQQSYHPPAESQPNYNPNLPAKLQQLLQFQAQTPYTNGIPEQFRFDITKSALSGHRQKRQTQDVDLSKYQRISQPSVQSVPQYSSNLPGSLKELLQFQAQVPYDIIANRINYQLDKPYVPQPIQAQAQRPTYQPPPQQQLQYQQPQRPAYQQPAPLSQPQYQQPQTSNQQSPLFRPLAYPNAAPQYQYPNTNNGIRPVTEN